MQKSKGKNIVKKLESLGVFPLEINDEMSIGYDLYLEEIKKQKIKSIDLKNKLKKLEIKANKNNYIITKDEINIYLSELNPLLS